MNSIMKIQRRIQYYGGSFKVVKYINDIPYEYISPFSNILGSDWDNKIIYLEDSGIKTYHALGGIIHEMGHVFACKEPPKKSDEFSFFGWEYQVAKELGMIHIWKESNKDYCTGTVDEIKENFSNVTYKAFGELSQSEQKAILAERVAHAKKLGLIKNKKAQVIR